MIRARVLAVPLAGLAVLAACGSSSGGGAATTAAPQASEAPATEAPATTQAPATEAPATEAPATTQAPTGFKVDTSKCADATAATAPIEGTVKIGAVLPLSGTPAVIFKPVADGMKLYYDYANANNLLPDYKVELSIEDDQYNQALTGPAVDKLIDQTGVNIFSGIIGTPNNLAVRDVLNEDCIPQLSALTGYPGWGDYEHYPWTTGALVPYNDETQIYADVMKTLYPSGGKVALFYVNNEFGQTYANVFKKLAPDAGFEIVDEQTIEEGDSNPPTSQVTSIASKKPDIILTSPIGAQCVAFLKELTNAEAANAGWKPTVFQTNTCAAKVFFTLAGAASDGVYTSSNTKDPNDPKNANDPAVKLVLDQIKAAGLEGDPGLIAAGWLVAETTVATLKQAAASADGLTRASIIEAARDLDYTPALFREPLKITTSATDGYPVEGLQVLQWQNASQTFKEIGSPITTYEGKTTLES